MNITKKQIKALIALSFKKVEENYAREIGYKEYCNAIGDEMKKPGSYPTGHPKAEEEKITFPKNLTKYFSQNFRKNDFKLLMKSHRIRLFYKVAGFDSLEEFLNSVENELPDKEFKAILSRLEIPYEDYDPIKKVPDYFIPDYTFDQIEFENSDVEINCITYSLWWAKDKIPYKLDEIKKTKNVYKYILTEESNQAEKRIREVLADDLKDQIQIRHLWKLPGYVPFSEVGIAFPIANDIVIYRNKYSRNVTMAVIGAKPSSSKEKNGCSIIIEDSRAFSIANWFDDVWEKLENK